MFFEFLKSMRSDNFEINFFYFFKLSIYRHHYATCAIHYPILLLLESLCFIETDNRSPSHIKFDIDERVFKLFILLI